MQKPQMYYNYRTGTSSDIQALRWRQQGISLHILRDKSGAWKHRIIKINRLYDEIQPAFFGKIFKSFERVKRFFVFLRHIIWLIILSCLFYVTFLRAKKVTKEGTREGISISPPFEPTLETTEGFPPLEPSLVCGRYVVGFEDYPPLHPPSSAEDLLFYETILIMVGDGALDVPPYKTFLQITNLNL